MGRRLAVVLALIGVGVPSCSDAMPVCCKEFNAGADMSHGSFAVDPATNVQLRAVAQGAGDLAAAQATAMTQLLTACKAIAVDLGESAVEPADVTDDKRLASWCSRAQAKLDDLKGSFTLLFLPSECAVDIASAAACKATCAGPCDAKANPPKCTGGKLEVACAGGCHGGGAVPTVYCEGVCSGTCAGSCESTSAAPSVACEGKCDGTCSVTPALDGTCVGTCTGKCTYAKMPPRIDCKGKCTGQCTNGVCKPAPGSITVTCDGECDADYTALRCINGTLVGGCATIDPQCETGCNASASAKAACAPPHVELAVVPGAPPNLQSTLETNLPAIGGALGHTFVLRKQIADMITVVTAIAAAGTLEERGQNCVASMARSLTSTSAQLSATLSAASAFLPK